MKIINEALLAEFRAEPCDWCDASPPSEPHHLWCRGMGGGNRLDVRWLLASLCRACHQKLQGNQRLLPELCFIVLRREMWRLRRMPKEAVEPVVGVVPTEQHK